MEEYLPKHLLEDEELSSAQAQEWYKRTTDTLERAVCPGLVHGGGILGHGFVEWRGEGKDILTPDGQRYFDCMAAGGVFGMGFAHPAIVEAVTRQAKRGGLGTRNGFLPGQAELAQKLLAITPEKLQYVAFLNTGTEAVEAAIKLARLTTGKKKLIGTKLGYHGMSLGTISLSGIEVWRQGIEPFLEGATLVEHGDIESLKAEIDEDTAAVVLEPIQWASGCLVAPPEYFKEVAALCQEKGALLILDEVQTGLGRTGYRFAMEHWGVEPDILCVGKILSGGMVPISAVVHTEQVHQAERSRICFNNSSYGGNPLACAAGIATLNLLEDRYLQRSRELGQLMGRGFELMVKKYDPVIIGYHGLGLMRCLEFGSSFHSIIFAHRMAVRENIIVASLTHKPEFVRISPPFVCEDEDIMALLAASERIMDEMMATPLPEMVEELGAKFKAVEAAMKDGQLTEEALV